MPGILCGMDVGAISLIPGIDDTLEPTVAMILKTLTR